MNCHSRLRNVAQNTFVRRGFTPGIVLGLQSVDRYNNVQPPDALPVWIDFSESAGYYLHVNTAFGDSRQEFVELAMSDQRIAAYDRQVQGLVMIHKRKHLADKLRPTMITQVAQHGQALQVIVTVGVTPRTAQWTLSCDFD